MAMKKWLAGLLVFLAIVAFVAYAMSWNLKRITINTYNQNLVKAPYDVIIVPGIPYDKAQQNVILKVRMFWAKNLLDKGIAKNIIFSGGAVHTPWVEGKVMKTIADSLGISSANTFAEDKAEHGKENVSYSYQLAKQLGFKKISLATDQYQNAFLNSFIAEELPDVAQLPVSTDSFPVYNKRQLPIVNARTAFVNNFVPLKERNQ